MKEPINGRSLMDAFQGECRSGLYWAADMFANDPDGENTSTADIAYSLARLQNAINATLNYYSDMVRHKDIVERFHAMIDEKLKEAD